MPYSGLAHNVNGSLQNMLYKAPLLPCSYPYACLWKPIVSVDRVEVNNINTPRLYKVVAYSVNSFHVTGIYMRKKKSSTAIKL